MLGFFVGVSVFMYCAMVDAGCVRKWGRVLWISSVCKVWRSKLV